MSDTANLLAQTNSPYLLQHADNPVHWRPWGRAALEAAQRDNRPILLSIGYAACHWCHVMAHESFENPEIGALINESFVAIKVDREERPDVDQIYMAALHALGRQGGWPLTMFLAPDGTPFWGGTYFPPEPRWGQPGFRQVLAAVAQAWATGAEAITQNQAALTQALAQLSQTDPGALPGPEIRADLAARYLEMVDWERGGLQGAPKFPNPPIFRFLWQESLRGNAPRGAEAVHDLLGAISLGGICDHLGGGYARYATDAEWLVPHFEKMLYDNAQILELLSLAHADRPDPLYAQRAAELVGWLQRDMATGPDGHLFAASEDADSEGVEGRFYVWTLAEITAALGPDAPAFAQAYDVTEEGNWEGHTILRRITPPGDATQEAALARSRATLLAIRSKRVRPGRDDKVLADWNALMIAALARASAVFARPDWLTIATDCWAALMAAMRAEDGRIEHAWRGGQIGARGLLEDQAAAALAALALFSATGDAAYQAAAEELATIAQAHFADDDGSFFASADDADDLPGPRPRSAADGATPSGNGLMAELCARLFHLTGAPRWRDAAEACICAFAGDARRLSGAPALLAAAGLLRDGGSLVICGPTDSPATRALWQAALASPDLSLVVQHAGAGGLAASHPAHGKPTDHPAAYACRGGTCGLPITDPAALGAPPHSPLG